MVPRTFRLLTSHVVLFMGLALAYSFRGSTSVQRLGHRRALVSASTRASTPCASTGTSAEQDGRSSLQGFESFVRNNPQSDKISAQAFHHVEFYCGDATNTYKRFMLGLGMEYIAKSDQSTGNTAHASYVLRSGSMRMVFTAPYPSTIATSSTAAGPVLPSAALPFPSFRSDDAFAFFRAHGLGVRAVALEVDDVAASHSALVQNGAVSRLGPTRLEEGALGWAEVAEVALYGDVVLRLVNSKHYTGPFLPHFGASGATRSSGGDAGDPTYGLARYDHIVGNVWELGPSMARVKQMTGFHDFAEFVAEDVGTVDSGLNSVVLANNNEMVLMPLNEPTYGTKRKSQIQTYLEQNHGEGVQHMALMTHDIFRTMRRMREAAVYGGFEFLDPQPASYYDNLPARLGDALTPDQYRQVRELGLLADKDDQGVLLQVFTKPVGDRPTLFLEIIQRIGCVDGTTGTQKPGCGGFGKGNFKDLFKSIEDYERRLSV
jgi:4-hydroxyphenylpyruvate dioxygenase